MNTFSKPFSRVQTCVLAFMFFILLLPILLIPFGPYLFLYCSIFFFLLPVLESFLLTPLYSRIGRFTYLSPLLIYIESNRELHLHIGSIYDYLINIERHEYGHKAHLKVLKGILDGLNELCARTKQGELEQERAIFATSYFFNAKSAKKLGFKEDEANDLEVFNLYLSYFSLAIRLSIIKGKLEYPKLSEIKKIRTTAGELLKHKDAIERMLSHVETRLNRLNDVKL
ncbi:hypothetical protein ABMY35_13560 [Pseudoalteromonas sp. BZB3]|uniref:hypothetical protein n=1 Tax=Pseudoalteromonas sp. BZB3 TaxID=3136670 RepID=UPI0032C46FB7